MFDAKRFREELLNDFLDQHPAQKEEDSVLSRFIQIMADVSVAAIEKYDRENTR